MVQYNIFMTILLYLLKFISLYEHLQETKVSFYLFWALLAENREKST